MTRRTDDSLYRYNEPKVNSFPPRRRLQSQRIKGALAVH